MPRLLSTTLRSHLEGTQFILVQLVDIATASGTQRFTDCFFDVTYDSNSYSAQGSFLGIGTAEESNEVIVGKTQISLSALETSNITTFATSAIINKAVTIRLAFLNPTDYSIIGDPVIVFKGKIQSYAVNDAKKTSTIVLEVASTFANFEKLNGRKTNQGSMQREHPNDFGFEFSDQTVADIPWGRPFND
jgi:hypothetical protein